MGIANVQSHSERRVVYETEFTCGGVGNVFGTLVE